MTTLPAQIAAAKRDLTRAKARYKALLRKLPLTSGPKGPMKSRNIRAVLIALETAGALKPSDIVNNTRLHRTTVHRLLAELLNRAMVIKHHYGLYDLPKTHISVMTSDEKKILKIGAKPK